MQVGQSQGGGPAREVCPTGLAIGDRYDEVYALDKRTYLVHTIEFHCVNLADGTRPKWRKFGSASPTRLDEPWAGRINRCPQGYLATGVHGRSGEFIDKLGFVCRPGPRVSRHIETGVNPRALEDPPTIATKPLDNVVEPPPPPASPRAEPRRRIPQ